MIANVINIVLIRQRVNPLDIKIYSSYIPYPFCGLEARNTGGDGAALSFWKIGDILIFPEIEPEWTKCYHVRNRK